MRIVRNDAADALPLPAFNAQLVPPLIELAFEAVNISARRLMRSMRRAGCVIDEKGLVWGCCLLVVYPVNGLIRHPLFQHRSIVGQIGNAHRAAIQRGVVLIGITANQAKEIFKPLPRRPLIKRPCRRSGGMGDVVRLTKHCAVIAVQLQYLCNRGRLSRYFCMISRVTFRQVGKIAKASIMMIATGQQRCTRRRTDARGMELIIANAALSQSIEIRCWHWPAKCTRHRKADIVAHEQKNIGRIIRCAHRLIWVGDRLFGIANNFARKC